MIVAERWHPTAVVDASAVVEPDVEIGPYTIVGKNCRIGSGTVLYAHVQVMDNTSIGRNCQVFGGAILGGPPQDLKFKGEPSFLEIGDGNILREYVTIHRATGEGNVTRIGDHNMVMAYAHIGHNCDIGSHTTIASYVGFGGHVTVEDYANFGGISGIHQHCRIGRLAMVGGMSGVTVDIEPYMIAQGRPAKVYDINSRGMKRTGVSTKVRGELRQAYKLLYRSNLNVSQALEVIEEDIESSPELEHLIDFIQKTRDGYNGRGNNPPPI
jgi:UDP-N-acetylglucosamine acyltransferase